MSTAPYTPENPQLRDALRALSERPRVRQADEQVAQAAAQLRFSEPLRRRWREARAEAHIRSAVAQASLAGVRASAEQLREGVAQGTVRSAQSEDVGGDVTVAMWRAQADMGRLMPDLMGNYRPVPPPASGLIAALHRDLLAPFVGRDVPGGGVIAGISEDTTGGDRPEPAASPAGAASPQRREPVQIRLDDVARPLHGEELPWDEGPGIAPVGAERDARRELIYLLVDLPGLPALVRAACLHAECASARPFIAGNAALGRVLARYTLVRDGYEPTGTAVIDDLPARDPAAYREALAAYVTGTPEGVEEWILWQAQALLRGIEVGHEIGRAVQAGMIGAPQDVSA